MNKKREIKRALISVSDKTGVVDFASKLANLGIEILSTGGTYKLLESNNISVNEVSSYTDFPEIMDGRVKTLHPKIHGGILGRRGLDDEVMQKHSINAIDLVIVNLYPFSETVEDPDCLLSDAIENIDIGGPTMIRAAAKNYLDVAVIVDHLDYDSTYKDLLVNKKSLSLEKRFHLMTKAFEHTAKYDGMIANYFGSKNFRNESFKFPNTINFQFKKQQAMRYGENPHQDSAFYIDQSYLSAAIGSSKQLQGKDLSFNNIADADAALQCVKQFTTPSCVIVKHANPCGVASAKNLIDAYKRAFKTDPESAFGGIIALNRELDQETATLIMQQQFVEVIIAPSVARKAREIISIKKNIRLLECGELTLSDDNVFDLKKVTGGLLIQDQDQEMIAMDQLKTVSRIAPSTDEIRDMLFTWKVAKMVKSNAIVYARNFQTLGIGAGQMSRVNSARIAAIKADHAGLSLKNAVMASDAFFPFRDGIDNAVKLGINCIIQPGGSMRDNEIIEAVNDHKIKMVFTSMRHFRH